MTYSQADAKVPPLNEQFPRWDFRESGSHRHWAIRTDQPTTPQIKAGAKLFLSGTTLDELADQLRAEETLLAGVGQ